MKIHPHIAADGLPTAPSSHGASASTSANQGTASVGGAPIHLHIERLVVEGLPVDWRHGGALQSAVETELARLFRSDGFPGAASRAEADVAAGSIRLAADAGPWVIGREVGRRVYSSLHPTGQSHSSPTRQKGAIP